MDRRKIGRRIAKFREEKNMRMIDVATELDYSTANYSKIEKGEICLDCRSLTVLCRIFQCQPENLVYGTPREYSQEDQYFSSYSEQEKRRILRLFYLACHCDSGHYPDYFHHLFGSCVLDSLSVQEGSHLVAVLEYERKVRNLTKRKMADYLQISKNKYYSILHIGELCDIQSLVLINRILGYPMSFLLWDSVEPSCFFSMLQTTEEKTGTISVQRSNVNRSVPNMGQEISEQIKKYGQLLLSFQN